jgi:hypothetical protein
LNIQNSGKALFVLTDRSGRIILSKTINGNGVIHLFRMQAGIYYLKTSPPALCEKSE